MAGAGNRTRRGVNGAWDIRPVSREQVAARIRDFVAVASDVQGEYWQEEHFLLDLPQKWELSLAVWDGDRPVGYAFLSRRTPQRAHLHHFMVSGELRGRGAGEALLSAAIALCRRHGCSELTLKVGAESAAAQRFYIRHGFSFSGGHGAYREMLRSFAVRTVAIHQPNYAPWLGYFAKMAKADIFVFLDDVQYSKNSYINRVQVDAGGKPRWLTVPASYSFGDAINAVGLPDAGWRSSHLDTLRTLYSKAPHFKQVWQWLKDVYETLPQQNLASSNLSLIKAVAAALGIAPAFLLSSETDTAGATGDGRLVALVGAAGGNRYLSGKGGSSYQDPAKFAVAEIDLVYSDFVHPSYEQGHGEFLPGLSVLDALFRLGFERTAELLKPRRPAS